MCAILLCFFSESFSQEIITCSDSVVEINDIHFKYSLIKYTRGYVQSMSLKSNNFKFNPKSFSKKDRRKLIYSDLDVWIELDSNYNIHNTILEIDNLSTEGREKFIRQINSHIETIFLSKMRTMKYKCSALTFNHNRKIKLRVQIN